MEPVGKIESVETEVHQCEKCRAHEKMENRVNLLRDKNLTEHKHILSYLDTMSADIKWMNIIGKWVLATMFGYYIVIGLYVLNNDFIDKRDLSKIEKNIGDTKKMYYEENKDIAIIKSSLDSVKFYMTNGGGK